MKQKNSVQQSAQNGLAIQLCFIASRLAVSLGAKSSEVDNVNDLVGFSGENASRVTASMVLRDHDAVLRVHETKAAPTENDRFEVMCHRRRMATRFI